MKLLSGILLATILVSFLSYVTNNKRLKKKGPSKKFKDAECKFFLSKDVNNFDTESKCISKLECESNHHSQDCGTVAGCFWVPKNQDYSYNVGDCKDYGECSKFTKEECMTEKQKSEYQQLVIQKQNLQANNNNAVAEARKKHRRKYGPVCFANDGATGCDADEFCTKDHYTAGNKISNREGDCLKKLNNAFSKCMKSSLVLSD